MLLLMLDRSDASGTGFAAATFGCDCCVAAGCSNGSAVVLTPVSMGGAKVAGSLSDMEGAIMPEPPQVNILKIKMDDGAACGLKVLLPLMMMLGGSSAEFITQACATRFTCRGGVCKPFCPKGYAITASWTTRTQFRLAHTTWLKEAVGFATTVPQLTLCARQMRLPFVTRCLTSSSPQASLLTSSSSLGVSLWWWLQLSLRRIWP